MIKETDVIKHGGITGRSLILAYKACYLEEFITAQGQESSVYVTVDLSLVPFTEGQLNALSQQYGKPVEQFEGPEFI